MRALKNRVTIIPKKQKLSIIKVAFSEKKLSKLQVNFHGPTISQKSLVRIS